MAEKKKKINSAISAAGRAASKTSSNVADQLKKKRKSAQQAAQMQEAQKNLPSWYGSIDTSRPRVQQRSTTPATKGRSVFAPQQQTTTQTTSRTGSMWPIVPKKSSAGLPSLSQVYGAPYRSDLAAYLPSSAMRGTVDPAKVTGAHYAEWMSDMADQKAYDEYRQQMVQSAKPQMKYQQHYNFETDRKRVERLEYQLRFENNPEERQRMQGEIDTILASAGTHSPEANEYARQYYQEKQDRADRSAARARARASTYMTAADTDRATGADVPTQDVDEGRRRIEEGLAEARRTGNQVLISAYEKALENYDANPEQYAGLVMNENERKAYAASTAAEEQDTDSQSARAGVYRSKANQYYLDMDRKFGFTAASQQPDFKEESKAPKKEFTYQKAITVNGNPTLINQPFDTDYHWDYMTDEEKATAIYLFNTKGDGTAKAYIFDYLGPGIDKVYAQDQQAKIYDEVSGASGWEKALYSGASVITNAVYSPMSYLNNAGQVVGNLIADKRGVGWTPVNSYGEFSRAARNTRISRQAVAESMGSVGAFFYQTGMSMLDNMILLPTGQTGTLGLMALEAADAQYAEDIDNGVDPEKAAISGAIAGGIEVLTEKVSLENLFKAPDAESFLRGLGKQALFEGSEEGASDVLNLIREQALYGENSYGTTEEEHKAWFKQLLLDIAGGAVSGAGMYAGYGGPQYVARRIGETKASGQQVLANDNGAALAQAYTDATGKATNTPKSVFQTGRVLEKTLNQGAKNYNTTYAQETGDAAVQYYQDNQQKGQEADKQASDTVYAAIRKVLADKKLTRREQAAMDSIPGVREAVAAYQKGGSMEGTVNREGSAKIKRGMENALLSVDHNLQSAGLDSNVETDIKASERMQQTAQGVQEAAQERKAMMQMREGESAQSQVDGQDVELLGMTGVGDKATLNVRNQDGQVQEVSLNDVTYGSDRKATAYAIGADMENTALANSFVATLADNQVPARVAAGMQAAYDYAYGGAPSVESLKGSILTEGLNDAQLNRAFELGQQARQSAVQVAQETKMKQALKQANVEWKGGTVDTSKVDMASLNAEQQRQVNLVQLVAGVTGINVELFQSKADANGRYRGENGSYNAATNTIRLDVNAGAYNAGELSQVTLLRTMSHELTHALQQNSLAQYEALKHAVLDVLTSKSGASIEEMAARKMEQDSSLKKADVALDEVVAEACENMLRDSDAMEQLIAQHPAEAKTFLEKMKQFFTDIVNAIRAAFGGSDTSRSREATALMQQAEEYLDICEKWSKALQDTAEISGRMERQTGDGDVQYSLRDGIEFMEDKYYARLLDNLDAQNNNGYIRVGSVKSGSVLSKVGLPATNLYFDVSKIEKALSAHGDHIDIDILKGIPSILRNPTVISEANVANTVNVFGEMQIGNSPIMVGIVVTPDRSGKNVINKVRTVHARRDIGNVITDSNVLYLSPDKKRTRTWFQARGNVVPLGGTRFGFIRSIAPSDGSVKHSLRENDRKYMDAVKQGDTAEAQKLVDAAAKAAGYKNLFYHGAKKGGGFTTFRGWSYFTENKGYAQRYSEAGNANSLYTTYVKMERPFDTRIPEVRELFDEARMEYGMGQLQDTGLPDWTDGYDLSEYIEENDLPYDGIVLDEGGDFVNGKPVSRGLSYVIRNSAQIKSADAVTYDDNGKVIPLSERFNSENDDIRYQLRDEDGDAQGLVGMFDEVPRLGEAHIDQRSWENMSDRRVHSFMNDYPASRMWLARMASILQSDVTASTAGQRFMNEEGTFMGQKRDTTPLLAEMKDSGYTWQQMADVFGKMAEVFENGDLEGKVPETALWKRAELILDRAVTEGYTDMNGIEYRPDAGYMRYKDELPGAKAREIPANAVEDTFEDVDNRLAGGENAAVQTGSDGERVQLQGDTAYQEKQRNAKSGIALMDDGPSNRELLSSALESAAQTPEELRYVQNYKKQAQRIAEMEGLLAERRAEVQQLQDMKNRTADQEIRMKNLQQSIAETESMIDKRDKGLLKMEAMEPLRNVLDRERAKYREKLKQAKKDAAARQREKDATKLGETKEQLTAANRQLKKAQMQRLAAQRAEKRKLAAQKLRLQKQADRRVEKIQDKANRRTLQGKIIRRVKALDTMLRTPSNTRHVPDALRGATANILQYFTDESKIFKAEDMQAAANAYAALNTEENSNMAEGMYDPDTYDRMVALMEATKKGQSLKKLSVDELTMVDKVLQNLSHIIQNANAVFVNGRRRNLEDMVNEEQQTLQEKGRYGSFKLKDNAFVDMLRRGNITAPYFFKHLGGPLGELGTAILNGETAYGIEVGRATERFHAIEEKYHRDAWKNKKGDTLTLKNGDGDTIQLTREQAMGVWATWKREHSVADRETHHLDQGGILLQQEKKLFKKTYAQDSAFRIGTAEMVEIDNWLTQEQKNYVDEVVDYLSNDMAELGNITSNALHGYSKFGEGYYYPFRTSDEFRPTKIGKDENAMPLKLMGFTKSVRSKSNAPVIVTDFTSTAADHINSMLTYYAFAEAQDNFMRLYNFRMDANHSIKKSLSGAYGANPGKYIYAFMRDMYGGTRMSQNERDANKYLSAFKKGAVMASLSVAIQQPSAIMRAMALIDPKYFVGSPLKGGFAEAQRYAGTAVIKDMGSFDTSTGRSAVQYITGDGAKTAYGKLAEFVSDKGGWLPEKMDAITWGRMWSAVKRETAARTGLNVNSEELKVQAGKRFDEVMRLTQVYDSTLAKSELMREKNMWAKMVTAFMAEPTVTYNMLMDAVIDAKGKRFGTATKSVGAVIAATLLNTMLSSVIYAMRDDDDEDATYFERYIKSLVGGLDPIDVTLNLVPMVKDVYEIFKGYDVERTDMSVFNDIYTYSKVLSNPDKSWLDRLKSGVSLAGIITGIPAKNLWRDIEGAVNTFKTVKGNDYRDGAAKMAALQGLSEWAFGPDVSKAATIDKLVRAMAKGDQAEAAAQMKTLSTFYEGDEKKRKTAIKKAGKEAYIDGGLTDAQALRVLEGIGITGDEADKVLLDWQYGKKTGGKTVSGAGSDYLEGEIDRETALDALGRTGAEEEDVETRMRKLDYQKESGISYSGLQDAYTDGRISRAEALRVRTEVGGQKPEEAEKTLLQWDYEKDTGRKWADMQKDFAAGTISESKATEYLMQYGSQKRKDAEATVGHWKYEVDTGRKWDEMQDDFEAGTITSKQAVKYLVDYGHRKTEDAKDAVSHWQYEKDTGRKWADMGYDYLSGSLTKVQAMSAMQKYGGKTEAEAYWTVDEWEYREVNPDADGYSKFHRVTELASRGQSISKAVQEIYTHSDYKTAKDCGSAVTSALTSYWKPLYIAATPAQREQMEPIMLAAYRAAYETLGEKYYGDKRRLKAIRKWLED